MARASTDNYLSMIILLHIMNYRQWSWDVLLFLSKGALKKKRFSGPYFFFNP